MDALRVTELRVLVFPRSPPGLPSDQAILAPMLGGVFEVDVVPRTVVGDLLGVIGVFVVATLFGGRDVHQIPCRNPDFDHRIQQVAWIDQRSPYVAAIE